MRELIPHRPSALDLYIFSLSLSCVTHPTAAHHENYIHAHMHEVNRVDQAWRPDPGAHTFIAQARRFMEVLGERVEIPHLWCLFGFGFYLFAALGRIFLKESCGSDGNLVGFFCFKIMFFEQIMNCQTKVTKHCFGVLYTCWCFTISFTK